MTKVFNPIELEAAIISWRKGKIDTSVMYWYTDWLARAKYVVVFMYCIYKESTWILELIINENETFKYKVPEDYFIDLR